MMLMMQMGAGGGDLIALVGGSVTSTALPLNPCTSTYTLNSTGIEQATITGVGAGTTNLGNWVTPTSHASLYEAMVSVVSGTLTGGSASTGVWLALSSARSWLVTATSGSAKSCDVSVQIRDVATATVQATANVTLEAFA